jgi:hypothetical protein
MKMSIILDVDWLVKRCQGSILLEGEKIMESCGSVYMLM